MSLESNQHPVDENQYQDIEYVVIEKEKRSIFRRVGCGILVVLWFMILLLPIALFLLAVNGDITIPRRGDIPDSHEHPLIQASLVMEADFRGLRITNTSLNRIEEDNLCIQTNINFVMWQGDGEPAVFCDCYVRQSSEDEWQLASTVLDRCE